MVRKGSKMSDKTKRKMSKANKGKNNPMYGKTHSEETKRKLSEVQREYTNRPEVREKVLKFLRIIDLKILQVLIRFYTRFAMMKE
ncbi:MAG: hypothetical protein EX285_03925 [Thaumarchaeota archaeon]|nr:hypothetical protein [Nitrososphaerota archaeon]